jgi:fibrillarin-like pre-rRNA processing protein
MEIIEKFPGVYTVDRMLATKNLAPGSKVYGERLVKSEKGEFRIWDLYRSKLAAAIKRGMPLLPIKQGSKVLYLGAASGTTPSHVSDIAGEPGEVYCVEFSARSMRDLIQVCSKRPNMLPIHADARQPHQYLEIGKVDCIYQDVAQPNQAEILLANAKAFLAKGGFAMLAVKSQSIDVTANKHRIFEKTEKELGAKFETLFSCELDPYDKDHLFLLLQYRG